jgi:hypothetical protein
MIIFSAVLKYHVNKDGRVKFTEQKTVDNKLKEPVTITEYFDVLPEDINLHTFKCYYSKDGDKVAIPYEIRPLSGTNRSQYVIPKNGKGITFEPGKTIVVTEYEKRQFFNIENDRNLYVFSFHHSLPPIEYLTGKIFKTIEVEIEKPSNYFSCWDIWCLKRPENREQYERHLNTFSDTIKLNFYFDLAVGEHYFNTIILRKRPRFNVPGPIFKAFYGYAKEKIRPTT